MGRRHQWFGAVLLLVGAELLLVGMVWGATTLAQTRSGQSHPEGERCNACHVASGDIRPEHSAKLLASQEALCGKCHQGAIEASHPSGFHPARPLPQVFPLDWKGDLTCSTCHRVHADTPGKIRVSLSGRDLCLSCHDSEFFERMRDKGISLVTSGHLDARSYDRPLIDPYSLQCMLCHEEEIDGTTITVDDRGIVRHSRSSINHPIGAVYDVSVMYGDYRPATMLDRSILLPNGKVSCVSCHAGYSRDHGQLVMSNARSGLCLECHDL